MHYWRYLKLLLKFWSSLKKTDIGVAEGFLFHPIFP